MVGRVVIVTSAGRAAYGVWQRLGRAGSGGLGLLIGELAAAAERRLTSSGGRLRWPGPEAGREPIGIVDTLAGRSRSDGPPIPEGSGANGSRSEEVVEMLLERLKGVKLI